MKNKYFVCIFIEYIYIKNNVHYRNDTQMQIFYWFM